MMLAQQGTLEISRSRLAHNLQLLRQRLGTTKICATIKADAYGHGIDLLSDLLLAEGVEWACVYSLREALDLPHNCDFNLLVLSPLVLQEASPKMIQHVLSWGVLDTKNGPFGTKHDPAGIEQGGSKGGASTPKFVRFNITDAKSARLLSESVTSINPNLRWPIHVQIDAGLTRMGVSPDAINDLLETIYKLPGLQLEGLFAHLSHGDVPAHPTVSQQLATYHRICDPIKKIYPDILLHIQNSGGALHLGDVGLDMVRVGIALYGLQPSTSDPFPSPQPSTSAPLPSLLPIAQLLAPVLVIHDRPANTGVGYGHTFITKRPSRLAIVPVGYADGYSRILSNRGTVQIREKDAKVVGRVSMDQIIVDVTDMPEVIVGEQVTVISWDPNKPNSLDKMADLAGTIGYELATHLGARLHRIIVD